MIGFATKLDEATAVRADLSMVVRVPGMIVIVMGCRPGRLR